jgi:hypothetical protein
MNPREALRSLYGRNSYDPYTIKSGPNCLTHSSEDVIFRNDVTPDMKAIMEILHQFPGISHINTWFEAFCDRQHVLKSTPSNHLVNKNTRVNNKNEEKKENQTNGKETKEYIKLNEKNDPHEFNQMRFRFHQAVNNLERLNLIQFKNNYKNIMRISYAFISSS